MRTCFLMVGIVLLTGCASTSERQREQRKYQEAENQAAYLDYRRRCHDSGGVVVVSGSYGRFAKGSVPGNGDYRCQKSLSLRY